MATVSSTSSSSTIDVATIVSQLMTVENQPLTRLDAKKTSYTTQLSAFGSLSSALASFSGAAGGLSDSSKLLALSTSVGNSSVLSASASSAATSGTHRIEVTQLAQSNMLAANGVASATSSLGVATLNIALGTVSGGSFDSNSGTWSGGAIFAADSTFSVVIGSGSDTLTGIRDAINAANGGVHASIVNDGSATPMRLVLTSDATGASQAIKINVGGNPSLSNLLEYDPGATQNMSTTLLAQDAALKIDGIAVGKSTNTISDALEGVTLNLTGTNAGTPTTLTLARDSAGIQSKAKAFVDGVNSVLGALRTLTGYDSNTATSGPLYGEATTQGIVTRIRALLNSAISGAGSITSLSSLGMSFQRDGTMTFDAAKFNAAMSAHPQDVVAAFASLGRTTDTQVQWVSSTARTTAGDYALNVTQLATHGSVAGSAAANLTITAGVNDTIDFTVDGVAGSVTLDAGTYADADALAAALQTRINATSAFSSEGAKVTVDQSGGTLTIRSAA